MRSGQIDQPTLPLGIVGSSARVRGTLVGSDLERRVLIFDGRHVTPTLVLLSILGMAAYRLPSAELRPLDRTVWSATHVVAHAPYLEPEENPPPPFVLDGPRRVRGLLEVIELDWSNSGFYCLCLGNYAFDFYDGEKRLARITYHHFSHLRWSDGQWNGDVNLAPGSNLRLANWLDRQGFHHVKDGLTALRAEEQREADEISNFYSFFPGSRIDRLRGNDKELAKAVFRAFSATSLPWYVTGEKEGEALDALSTVSPEAFRLALEEITDDSDALLGYARIFFQEDFDHLIPNGQRDDWGLRLSRVVLARGDASSKDQVLRYLGGVESGDAEVMLRDIAAGRYSDSVSLYDEEDDEPSLRAGACLKLALRGDQSIGSIASVELQASPDDADRAAYELALAALGDVHRLKPEHFELSSYTIGFAGLEVIERLNGAHGMNALVDGAFGHPWAAVREESVLVFERITGHVVWNRAQGSRSSWYRKDAKEWWAEHGAEFVEQRRSGRPR